MTVISLAPALKEQQRRKDARLLKQYLERLRSCGLTNVRILNTISNTILTKGGVKKYRSRMESVINGERFDLIGFR